MRLSRFLVTAIYSATHLIIENVDLFALSKCVEALFESKTSLTDFASQSST